MVYTCIYTFQRVTGTRDPCRVHSRALLQRRRRLVASGFVWGNDSRSSWPPRLSSSSSSLQRRCSSAVATTERCCWCRDAKLKATHKKRTSGIPVSATRKSIIYHAFTNNGNDDGESLMMGLATRKTRLGVGASQHHVKSPVSFSVLNLICFAALNCT